MSGPSKIRVFLASQASLAASGAQLQQVATLAMPAEDGTAIVDALNTAAWSGDDGALTALFPSLPDAIVQACRHALATCPAPEELVLSADGHPMQTLQHLRFGFSTRDLATAASAAYDLGLQFMVRNVLGNHGIAEFEGCIMDRDREIDREKAASWWAAPEGMRLLERLTPSPDELADVLQDERWDTQVARAYWLYTRDQTPADADREDSWEATAEWFVEFWDAPLEPDRNIYVFVPDDLSEEERGVITPRTRFLLWQALHNITVDLDGMLDEPGNEITIVKDDLPAIVQDQPREWWVKLFESAERLCEAARRAKLEELVPRTPAEEALIYLASTDGYVGWARDNLLTSTYQEQYDRLPHCEDDDLWEEVLGDLTRDIDIELMWNADLAHIGDPSNFTNQFLRMGDYRPQAWHELFFRARHDQENTPAT